MRRKKNVMIKTTKSVQKEKSTSFFKTFMRWEMRKEIILMVIKYVARYFQKLLLLHLAASDTATVHQTAAAH